MFLSHNLILLYQKHQPKFYALFSHENSNRAKTSANYPSKHSSWWKRFHQDEYVRLGPTSSEDVFKTSSGRKTNIFVLAIRLQDVLQKHLQNIFKTSCKNVFKTSLRRLAKVSSRLYVLVKFVHCKLYS